MCTCISLTRVLEKEIVCATDCQTKNAFLSLPGKPVWNNNLHRASAKLNTTWENAGCENNLAFVLKVKLGPFSTGFPFKLLLFCQKIDHQLFTFSYLNIVDTMHLFMGFEDVQVQLTYIHYEVEQVMLQALHCLIRLSLMDVFWKKRQQGHPILSVLAPSPLPKRLCVGKKKKRKNKQESGYKEERRDFEWNHSG